MAEETGPWIATCDVEGNTFCEWSQIVPREEYAKILMVMHIVVKHPAEYKKFTGKDPEEMAYTYREFIDVTKKLL